MSGRALQDPNQPQPGWYPDTRDQQLLRWWDGAGWTAQTQPMPGTAGPRQPYSGYQRQAQLPGRPWQGKAPWPQQPGMPIQVNQQASFPSGAITRRPLGVLETCFHIFMTFCTFGFWAPVWWGRVRMRRSYTTFR